MATSTISDKIQQAIVAGSNGFNNVIHVPTEKENLCNDNPTDFVQKYILGYS